jgi:hypothetical protein
VDLEGALTVRRTVAAPDGGSWSVLVAHTDGRAWEVAVTQSAARPPRPESCDGPLGSPATLTATGLTAVSGRS